MGEKGASPIIVIAIVVVIAVTISILAIVIHSRLSSDWPLVKSNVEKISIWENGSETLIDPQSPKIDKVGEILVRVLESPVGARDGIFDDNRVMMLKEMAKLVEMRYKQGENSSQSTEYFDFLFILEADPLKVGIGNGSFLKGQKNPTPEIMQSEMLYIADALTKGGEIDKSWVHDLVDILP
jgi:hypothetical protein